MAGESRRLIIGITGASGVVYGVRLLELLRDTGIETHLVMTRSAELTLAYETDLKATEVKALATRVYPVRDVGAAIASGSYRTMGMIIAPCSVRSMAAIATGVTSTLLTRAADVVLKERRRLVVMIRETPLHAGHLRSLTQLAEIGAIVYPPVPAFYSKPASIADMVDHTVGRVLDLFDIDLGIVHRWPEQQDAGA
jgi:4-hydroxy-3-polyprenylbenzoate decarboxylase